MSRYLGVECPNCLTLFAVAEMEGSVSTQQHDPMVFENVECPHCKVQFPQLTAEVVEFEAETSPVSGVRTQ
jgi:phage FluMu protein Com